MAYTGRYSMETMILKLPSQITSSTYETFAMSRRGKFTTGFRAENEQHARKKRKPVNAADASHTCISLLKQFLTPLCIPVWSYNSRKRVYWEGEKEN